MRTWKEALPDGIKTDYLMNNQARTGVHFDQEAAMKLWEYCNTRMKEIEEEVEPKLPQAPLNKTELKDVTPPVRQERMGSDGLEPSSYMLKFKEKMQDNWGIEIDISNLPIPSEPVITEGKMRLKHQEALKNYLMQKWGWRPTLWNYKKGKDGKPERDSRGQKVKTSPKFHEGGTLCPNLEALGDIADVVKPIVEWLSLRNRRSVIWNPEKQSGWLEHPRLKQDGRLPAGSSGLTYTHRQKHKVVANIPRVTSTLGKEMRALFCAPEGRVLVGYDASSLEAVVKGHFAFKYEGGAAYFEKITDPNFDEHQETADAWGLESRQDAKAGNYGLQYNQSAKGLAETYGVPVEEGERRHALYWENNKPYKMMLDNLEKHWKSRNQKSIYNPCTGYVLNSRSAHSLGSLLIQHTGALIMDISGLVMDEWLGGQHDDSINQPYYLFKGTKVLRVLYYHDEYAFECEPSVADEVLELGKESIREAGRRLGLNVPLDADGAVGKSWADIH